MTACPSNTQHYLNTRRTTITWGMDRAFFNSSGAIIPSSSSSSRDKLYSGRLHSVCLCQANMRTDSVWTFPQTDSGSPGDQFVCILSTFSTDPYFDYLIHSSFSAHATRAKSEIVLRTMKCLQLVGLILLVVLFQCTIRTDAGELEEVFRWKQIGYRDAPLTVGSKFSH